MYFDIVGEIIDIETIAYIAYLAVMGWLIFGHNRKPSAPQPA